MTMNEIADAMGFDEETCKKNLQSLMQPRTKILDKVDGKFKVVDKFNSPYKRVNFPVPMLEEAVKKERIT
jgi:hypothetical protein